VLPGWLRDAEARLVLLVIACSAAKGLAQAGNHPEQVTRAD